ncbi:beta-ketoacyl synthase N-terminal-like domain-containing protein [Ramlibacter ginsenosidimutans]|uniref:beta-ketoacyl synthase N-terminal-like domain-containing protein n=1 Tax=Ramlibacter ginsenosidimutans TaxID=502333 RepID=UPI00191F719C
MGVVGMGLVSPLGNDVEAAWRVLLEGGGAVRRIDNAGLPPLPVASASFDVSTVLNKLQQVGTERVSHMALMAARAALADAGGGSWNDPDRVGVYVGTGMGGASTMDHGYAALHSGGRIPPLTVPAGMANGAAAVIAMHMDIRGPVLTYAVACASSAVAIAEAAHALRRGEVDMAIAGGAEALLVPGALAAWHALRALAPPQEDDVKHSCRPFSRDRSGLVLGEGSAFLVLERERDMERSARAPYAWLAGSAVRCDAVHLTNPAVRGQVAALRAALAASELTPADVGYCNAHGTATVAGDPVECEALRAVWKEAAPKLALSSTKAAHGHLLGAAGALEAVWTIQALRTGDLPPTQGVVDIDAACAGLDHVLHSGVHRPGLRHAISNSFAFGGTNATLVFSKA